MNVVSLIDVMLLLLVIFMITAPMMQGGVDIALPPADAKPLESKDGLAVTVNRAGEIFIDDEKYTLPRVPRRVQDACQEPNAERRVSQGGQRRRAMGSVAQILAIMKADGVTNVGSSPSRRRFVRWLRRPRHRD